MNGNAGGDQVGNPRRFFGVLLLLVMAVVICAFDATDFAADDDADLEASDSPVASVDADGSTATSAAVDVALIARPDSKKTPGDVLTVTAAQICADGYAKSVRNDR